MKTTKSLLSLSLILIFLPFLAQSNCDCNNTTHEQENPKKALNLKFIAIVSILSAGALGVVIPIVGKTIKVLRPESNFFFVIKAFAAGVILATGLIHILPAAFQTLTSPCLTENPWQTFPFAGFVAMCSAMGTMMIDSFATGYYKRSHFSKARPVDEDDGEGIRDVESSLNVHGHGGHGHGHGGHGHGHGSVVDAREEGSLSDRIRHRVVSQVLEMGILIHSVIIGISLGTSQNSSTIRPLVGALSFHQFFEGVGLGGCIVQANFKAKATVIMAVFFSFTAPIGIALGIAICSVYNDASSTALIVEGLFNSASAGILVYMALVDLLAADFMNPRMQSNVRLQLGTHLALLLGAGLMSLIAKWA